MVSIRTTDLSKGFLLDSTSAKLTITSGNKVSSGIITLPYTELALPPITLGKDFIITPPIAPVEINKYDLNNDGIVNAADLSIVVSYKGSNPKDKKADLNNDKIVDQKDLDLISKEIERVSKK